MSEFDVAALGSLLLPLELIYEIAGYLPTNSLAALNRTCKCARYILHPVLYTQPMDKVMQILKWGGNKGRAQEQAMLNLLPLIIRANKDDARIGHQALVLTCQGGALNMVCSLICNGIPVNPAGNQVLSEDNSPLMQAIRFDHPRVVETLIDAEVDWEKVTLPTRSLAASKPDAGRGNMLHYAAIRGAYRVMDLLVSLGIKTRYCDQFGRSPLSLAAEVGCADTVRVLIKYKADINSTDKDQRTPLMHAVLNGHVAAVKALLDAGARLDLAGKQHRGPLSHAAARGYPEIIRALLDGGANFHEVDGRGRTPLVWAACNGHSKCIRVLLEAGASPDISDKDTISPLHLAAIRDHFLAIQALIEGGANVGIVNHVGRSPLSVAIELRRSDIIGLLIDHGADLYQKSYFGRTPLSYASAEVGRETPV
ncbi:ankyrin repeat-containing domain protein [Aspergillus cavernicola]|uniref:protein S-acyltransferase n=1 Tax=Aspergillus cavernicola TaxID=176166 RepID=A0ABR4IXK2_9EURO